MADFFVVSDVSTALINLLREGLCPEPIASPESIKLISPTDKNTDYMLGLFLYDIKEQGEIKSTTPIRRLDNTRTPPPKPLTLYYMLFLNSKSQIAAAAEMEQRVLGRCIQLLADSSLLNMSGLHSVQEEEGNAALALTQMTFEEKTRIWTALNVPYQLGVHFTITPVLLSSRRSDSFRRVTDISISSVQRRED